MRPTSPRELRLLLFMIIELTLLAASIFAGIVHIVVVSHLQSWRRRGYRWTASSREQPGALLTGVAGRVAWPEHVKSAITIRLKNETNDARTAGFRVREFQPDTVPLLREQPLSPAEDQRMHPD